MRNSAIIREQLQDTLKNMAWMKSRRPIKGWIRSIREALGMSGRQLAQRLDVKTSRIPEMEKAEGEGSVTLKTLRRAAEAMECELVYAFVPKENLEASLRKQAEKAARANLKTVAHTMGLEDQGLAPQENADMETNRVAEWVRNPPRWLWDIR